MGMSGGSPLHEPRSPSASNGSIEVSPDLEEQKHDPPTSAQARQWKCNFCECLNDELCRKMKEEEVLVPRRPESPRTQVPDAPRPPQPVVAAPRFARGDVVHILAGVHSGKQATILGPFRNKKGDEWGVKLLLPVGSGESFTFKCPESSPRKVRKDEGGR